MKTFGFRLKSLDLLLFALALGIIALIAVKVYATTGTPVVRISGSGQEWVFPLDAEETLRVPGPLGDTVVRIHDGSVRVLDSPCPEKICVATGAVSRPGQTIACLPNRVLVVIRGQAREEVDAFSF
jgi:hypothetical protein